MVVSSNQRGTSPEPDRPKIKAKVLLIGTSATRGGPRSRSIATTSLIAGSIPPAKAMSTTDRWTAAMRPRFGPGSIPSTQNPSFNRSEVYGRFFGEALIQLKARAESVSETDGDRNERSRKLIRLHARRRRRLTESRGDRGSFRMDAMLQGSLITMQPESLALARLLGHR
jgi:hypothetical protein